MLPLTFCRQKDLIRARRTAPPRWLGNQKKMSKTTIALEAAVAVVIENTPAEGVRQTFRQRANADKAFAQILKLIGSRIRHFVRQYGLSAHWEDAEQCCAIGVHRAIQAYEPEKAQFTTFVNWQLRGELQSLRFRLMTDQRPSAKKVDAMTVSLHEISSANDSEENAVETTIEDIDARLRTEAGASDYFAECARDALIDRYVDHLRSIGMEQLKRRARATRASVQKGDPDLPRFRGAPAIDADDLTELEKKVAQHRAVVERRLFDDATLDEVGNATGVTKERVRQIANTAAKIMGELASSDPSFAIMGSAQQSLPRPARARKPTASPILIATDAAHNQFTRVIAINPTSMNADGLIGDLTADADAQAGAPSGFAARSKSLVD